MNQKKSKFLINRTGGSIVFALQQPSRIPLRGVGYIHQTMPWCSIIPSYIKLLMKMKGEELISNQLHIFRITNYK